MITGDDRYIVQLVIVQYLKVTLQEADATGVEQTLWPVIRCLPKPLSNPGRENNYFHLFVFFLVCTNRVSNPVGNSVALPSNFVVSVYTDFIICDKTTAKTLLCLIIYSNINMLIG